MLIRPFIDTDKEEVIPLILGIQQEEFYIPISLDSQPDLISTRDFYQKNGGEFWVAVDEEKIIGTIALRNIGDSLGALRKMFVHASYRGKMHGIAQNLLYTLLAYAREKGFKKIFLGTTEKFVAAQRFYEKNGFIEISKTSLPAAFPVMSVDVKFYSIDIT